MTTASHNSTESTVNKEQRYRQPKVKVRYIYIYILQSGETKKIFLHVEKKELTE
jgi:hypothetical protein